MTDTCRVFKEPVRCAACGSRQYETMLRIAEGAPVTCVACQQTRERLCACSPSFSQNWLGTMVACTNCNWGAWQPALPLSGRSATLDGYYPTGLVSPHRNINLEAAVRFLLAPA
jgi:hypothetical protein